MLLLEEFTPRIEYIKGTNNLVADAISCLEYTPSKCIISHFHFMKSLTKKYDPNVKHHIKWKDFSCLYNSCKNSAETIDVGKNIEEQTAVVMSCFASCGKEEQEEIYPPSISEVVDAQGEDKHLQAYFRRVGRSKSSRHELCVVEDTKIVTENGKIVIPFCLQKDHLEKLEKVLQKLHKAGLKVN